MTSPAPHAPALDDAGFVVTLDRYSGPLDLLLHLIRREEIEIWDIPIARIADQFLRVIKELGLDEAADYLEMAARLLRIKVQLLLPRPGDVESWEDPRHELVRRLLEYQQIREVVDWMERAARRRAAAWGRGWLPPEPDAPPPPLTFDLDELLAAIQRVLQALPEPAMYRILPRPLDVEGATKRILESLADRQQVAWRDLLGETPTVVDVLSALVAVLELARRGLLNVIQPAAFQPLLITRGTANTTA